MEKITLKEIKDGNSEKLKPSQSPMGSSVAVIFSENLIKELNKLGYTWTNGKSILDHNILKTLRLLDSVLCIYPLKKIVKYVLLIDGITKELYKFDESSM